MVITIQFCLPCKRLKWNLHWKPLKDASVMKLIMQQHFVAWMVPEATKPLLLKLHCIIKRMQPWCIFIAQCLYRHEFFWFLGRVICKLNIVYLSNVLILDKAILNEYTCRIRGVLPHTWDVFSLSEECKSGMSVLPTLPPLVEFIDECCGHSVGVCVNFFSPKVSNWEVHNFLHSSN